MSPFQDPAVPALLAFASAVLVSGIAMASIAESFARSVAEEGQTALIATRSRYVLGQVSDSLACAEGSDGCDGTCTTIDLASSVPTYAYFHFYNITNPDEVTAGATPQLAEVGPYTCLTAPPVMTARITRTSSTLPSDASSETMTYDQTLECDAVHGGADLVYLVDKQGGVQLHAVSDWIATLKGDVLSSSDTVGTGGAPEFMSYAAHGNVSVVNNYMRRTADDAPVLPIFPHAYLPDDLVYLKPQITTDTILQWHIASVGSTVSFTWQYPLFLDHPVLDFWLYARFVATLSSTDLTSRGSDFFDTAYSYHTCGASSIVIEADPATYPGCATKAEGRSLSEDDFFIDINLMLGIPAPSLDTAGAGSWQAFEIPSFASMPPNCTGTYGEPGALSAPYWAWGFWGGTWPYISHTEEGYNPYAVGKQGKWLAEFGVTTTTGSTIPAFAFSMMPKMHLMVAPSGFPFFLMGKELNAVVTTENMIGQPITVGPSSYMWCYGQGVFFFLTFFAHSNYVMFISAGVWMIIVAVMVLLTAAYRMKVSSKD